MSDLHPLFSFDAVYLTGEEDRLIVYIHKSEIFLSSIKHPERTLKLDLPVPYNNDSVHTQSSTYDTWDNLNIEFITIEQSVGKIVIDVTVRSQNGYSNWDSFDDAVPPVEITKNILVVTCQFPDNITAILQHS